MNRFSGRQVTVMVVAVCAAIVAAPVAALAVVGSFSSTSASTPAVSARNSSSGSGAKAVYGNASATSGTVYGVYGRTSSTHGYGVYSAGRLGTSGALVCSHCVTGGDVNAATLPTVPNASKLGGNSPSYYARIVPLSRILPADGNDYKLADLGGLQVHASCSQAPRVELTFRTDDTASNGTLNYFFVTGDSAGAHGLPLSTSVDFFFDSTTTQEEGTATYRNNATGRVVTVSFHLYGPNCEVFGNILTTA